ncbi:MAG: hypothetical protein Crog4KO_01600 [Crocinitomicaceae bacterium]
MLALFVGAAIAKKDYYLDFYGLLLMIALASTFCGVFFGLLFGVPKLNDKFNPSTDYNKKHKYMPNTNLEEMSDWLTKILVGVSLTQLTVLPDFFKGLSMDILSDVDKNNFGMDLSHAIVISTIIYFLIVGFLIGYLYTRLFLPNLLAIMEDKDQKKFEAEIWEASYGKSAKDLKDLSGFTLYEQNVLNTIAKENNLYTVTEVLPFQEYTAFKVLIRKGAVEITSGGHLRVGATMKIADPELLKKVEEKAQQQTSNTSSSGSTDDKNAQNK